MNATATGTIEINLSHANDEELFDGAEDATLLLIDVGASLTAYEALVESLVREAYPTATVTWSHRTGLSHVFVPANDSDPEDAECAVNQCYEVAFERANEWLKDEVGGAA